MDLKQQEGVLFLFFMFWGELLFTYVAFIFNMKVNQMNKLIN